MAKAVKRKIPQEFKDLILPNNVFTKKSGIGLSQTIFNGYQKCDRFIYYYLNRWGLAGSESNFFFGSLFHEMLDVFYSAGRPPKDVVEIEEELQIFISSEREKGNLDWIPRQVLEYYIALTVATIIEYFSFYRRDFIDMEFEAVEESFEVEYEGLLLTGKRDGIIKLNGEQLLFEHKTKGFIKEEIIEQKLSFDFQVMFYILSDYIEQKKKRRLEGALYNIIRKSGKRMLRNEEPNSFLKSLRKDIQKTPEHYFLRFKVLYDDSDFIVFEYELKEKLKRLKELLNGQRVPLKNESSCVDGFGCQYLKACSSNLDGYKQRKLISPEL
jgi:hypothetical protein